VKELKKSKIFSFLFSSRLAPATAMSHKQQPQPQQPQQQDRPALPSGSKLDFSIDRGGTFTDVYAECHSTGQHWVYKLLSVDPAYPDAPREGIRKLLEQGDVISHIISMTSFSHTFAILFLGKF